MRLVRRTNPYKLSELSKKRLEGLDPRLVDLVLEMLYYFDVSVIEGRRTPETQRAYFESGVSQTLASKHLDGLAVDLYPYPIPRLKNGEIDSSSREWDKMALVAYYCAGRIGMDNLEWGGTWTSLVDKPHFQLS